MPRLRYFPAPAALTRRASSAGDPADVERSLEVVLVLPTMIAVRGDDDIEHPVQRVESARCADQGICRFTYQQRNSQVCASYISHTLCHAPGGVSMRTFVSIQFLNRCGHSPMSGPSHSRFAPVLTQWVRRRVGPHGVERGNRGAPHARYSATSS